jgi:hypothetical protein
VRSEILRRELPGWLPFALAVATMLPAGFLAQRFCAHAADALEALLVADPDSARRAVERALYGFAWVVLLGAVLGWRIHRRRRG